MRTQFLLPVYTYALCSAAFAQKLPPVTIDIGLANGVLYLPDTTDYTKFGTLPGPVAPGPAANGLSLPNFTTYLEISDVASVNGQPMKGTFVNQGRFLRLSPAPRPGQAVSDSGWYTIAAFGVDLITPDGIHTGTIYSSGFAIAAPPPGAPSGYYSVAIAVQGGTGAFVSASGQCLVGNRVHYRGSGEPAEPGWTTRSGHPPRGVSGDSRGSTGN